MRKKLLCICALQVLFILCSKAQMDTLVLENLEVYGIPNAKYGIGQKVLQVDSATLQVYQNTNLGDLLSAISPVYIKSYGSNMASTISFRGTGASHTGVFWNGLNINSRSLGQSDFSLLPIMAADEISVQYGASSTLYGSDAIGGTVHLTSIPNWSEGFDIYLNQGYGSFNTNSTQGVINYCKGKVQIKTKAYYKDSQNDFEYTLPSTKQVYRQNNASYHYYGISQDVNVRLAANQHININGWYNFNNRALQPVIGNFTDDIQQEDENLRVNVAYHHNSNYGFITLQTGFINDYQLYDDASVVESSQLINQLMWDKSIGKVSVRSGISWNRITGEANNYDGKKEEDRSDGFILIQYDLNKVKLSTNFRKTFVSGYSSPLVPSLGIEYQINKKLKLTSQLSRNYRVPTLNDRYWDPGGNPSLRPELSYNVESGIETKIENLTVTANYYKIWVTDWIIWVPESNYWTPKNIQKVNSEGVELSTKFHHSIGQLILKIYGGYSYNLASNKGENEQLPYTPKHNANANLGLNFKQWHLTSSARYVGERSTLGNTILEDYVLVDTELGYAIKKGENRLGLTVAIKNMLNKNYQTYLNRAMPGRNYQLNLIYKLEHH